MMDSKTEKIKCLIIGSGPAGYTAAIYASRTNLKPVLYKGIQPGGQLTTTNEVENFPGYPEGVTGTQLMEDLYKQALRFGADIRDGIVTAVNFLVYPFLIIIDEEKKIEAEAVIIATGASAKYLGLPSEDMYRGQGVSACATCDGFFYKGQDIAVAGGGDTAAEDAVYLSNLCNKVYMIVRKPFLRASKNMQEKVFKTKNIEILFEHTTKEILGDESGVNGLLLTKNDGEEIKINITGFFVAIGHEPNSQIFRKYITTDETGYIITIPGTTKTNIPGIFACGDVQDKHYRQAITAAGSGCMAALEAERYLMC
ncbi:MAG: thioredoxin-disulfide reductase [Bacteroidia bacterium]|nr:thioredoxin-disulfide reductase [Bacteroidia bacterium]